ncbi:MAG: hypothetical protein A2W08_15470 [Candidatus Rokubacteria bacterium RBG_16_73_20]|nr:MAG: hypothetical protein A2050_11280 [Candidatus Rokubacteria bacterium GWA2_73_35]OGK93444.1 MAG: hypothetical protein A2W08_15470 [Candidatus Rokubacteria bacterium RBG_16_73_20]
MTDFAALLCCLGEAGVEFILVGGAAATAHGSARLTQDVDVVYRRSSANIARLVTACAPPRGRGRPPAPWSLRSAKRTVTCLRSPSRALREVRMFWARCRGV